MKAIVLNKIGGQEMLKVSEVHYSVAGKGEVIVKNQFIGINYAEILPMKGLYSWDCKVTKNSFPRLELSTNKSIIDFQSNMLNFHKH